MTKAYRHTSIDCRSQQNIFDSSSKVSQPNEKVGHKYGNSDSQTRRTVKIEHVHTVKVLEYIFMN